MIGWTMPNRKEKILTELYNLTDKLSQPEITPVLKGSCRIQGPVEELDLDLQQKSEASPTEKKNSKAYLHENILMRAESGTCNVCATPCSSCMHFSGTVSVMESKIEDECSEEICKGKESHHCSFSDSHSLPLFKSRACDERQRTASETSNLLSASSSHDSVSENAESKAPMKTFDASDICEDVEMLPKLSAARNSGEDQTLARAQNIVAQSGTVSSHKPVPSDLRRTSFRKYEEQRGLECHGDNISCVTGVNDADISTDDFNVDLDRKDISCQTASMEKVEKAVHTQTASGSVANSSYEMVESTRLLSTSTGDAKDLEENSSLKLLGERSPFSLQRVESSLKADGYKFAAVGSSNVLTDTADGKGSHARISSPMKIYPCLEAENSMHGENPPPMSMKSPDINQQMEKPLAVPEVVDVQGPSSQSRHVTESENSDSDVAEDDVKVCDICGDAGREEWLAICSRCTDGAEHTYCMRIMLDKVPEGDWLCEGCKFNEEAEKRKAEKTEAVSAAAEAPLFSEEHQNNGGTFNPKLLPKLDTKIEETEANSVAKSITSPLVSAKRHADALEIAPISKKRAIETGVRSSGALSPGKKLSLSRESSFKNMDGGKGKPAHHGPLSSSHSANNSQQVSHSIGTSNPNSSRPHARLQSPHGNISRSPTFNSSNLKPKVKQVMEDASQKQKLAKESASSDARKEGSTRMINKSASFKNASSGCSNAGESKAKMQSVNPSRTEDPKSLKPVKEQILERKYSFRSDRSNVSSSPKAATSMSHLKSDLKRMLRDPKVAQADVKSQSSSDQTVSATTKGAENIIASDGSGEVKKQSHLPSCSRSPSSNGICHSEEKKPCQVGPKDDMTASSSSSTDKLSGNPEALVQDYLPQSLESSNREGKTRQTVSDGVKSLRCHRCNEMGHIAQFCTGVNLRVSALKASAEKSSREMATKSNRWKDAVGAAISKNRDHKISTLSDQYNGLSTSSADLSSEIASKEQLGNSTADPSRATAPIIVKQHEIPTAEAKCGLREADMNVIPTVSDETNPKPYMRKLPSQVPAPTNPLRISAIPEHDYIWQGVFEVRRSGRVPDICEGIQVHLSTCASPKVRDVVNKFPYKVQLDEVARVSSWPLQFHGGCAPEDSIALYFFAKDFESYERHYKKLLENMLKNDLALKGNVDGVELLVFLSNLLPVKSHRWNRLFYLWAVFREKRESCSGSLSVSQKNLSVANSVMEPMVRDLPTPTWKSSHDIVDCQLSGCDKKPKLLEVPAQSSDSAQLPSFSSYRSMNGSCPAEVSPLDPSSNAYHDLNMSVVDDGLLAKKQSSCLAETHPSTSISLLPSVLGNCSSSKTLLVDGYLSSEVKSTSLNEVFRNSEYGKSNELQPCKGTASVRSGLNKGKVVPVSLETKCTSDCEQACSTPSSLGQDSSKVLQARSLSFAEEAAPESSRDSNRIRDHDNERSMGEETSEEIMVKKLLKKEQGCWELTPRKRLYSDSSETVSEPSGEPSKNTSQTFGCKEKMDQMAVDRENECKKLKKCHSESNVRMSHQEQILGHGFPRRIFDAEPSFPNGQRGDCVRDDDMLTSNTGATERYFFPVTTGPSTECHSGNFIPFHVISSDDEDTPETDVPNLELALGAKKKSTKQRNLPFFLDLVDDKSTKKKVLDSVKEDADDDASASLSLTLAFPFSDKDKNAKPVPKAENHVNRSLLLFGSRFTDS